MIPDSEKSFFGTMYRPGQVDNKRKNLIMLQPVIHFHLAAESGDDSW